ncbi:NAD-dependent epimerase [Candidatus Poribacteria bacterium]|nr:NAD-dependent epimerase [Candidatus Poribacteria bacterium]
MKVFLTGSTGFVGSYVLRALLDAGHDVRVLLRAGSEKPLATASDAVEIAPGDVTDGDSLVGLLDGCEAVVHLVGIIREDVGARATFERVHLDGARNVVDAATTAGVQRFVLMSANGAKPREDAVSAYQWTKYEAEEHLRASGMEHVIFRPSVIFGRPRPGQPEFASQLAGSLLRVPLAPLPLFKDGLPTVAELAAGLSGSRSSAQRNLAATGSGIELQPVAVENVATAMAQAVDGDGHANTTYEVGGRDRFRWGEMLDVLAAASGARRPRRKVVLPAALIRLLLSLPVVRSSLPLTTDQLDMLLAGNVCDEGPFFRDFDVDPIWFGRESLTYVRRA